MGRVEKSVEVAMLQGLACAYAQHRRMTWDATVEQMRDVVDRARFTGEERIRALSRAAAMFVMPSPAWEWFAPDAVDVLVGAGADRQLATEMARTAKQAWATGAP